MTITEPIPPRDDWVALPPGQMISNDDLADFGRQKGILRQIRGNIIAHALDIEFAIDVAIREILFSIDGSLDSKINQKIEDKKNMFDKIISKSGMITFDSKIKVLKALLQENQIITEEDQKKLMNLLKSSKNIRNKFAHRTTAFEVKKITEKTQLTPYIVEKGVKIYLDEEYFGKVNRLYSECLIRVENITRKIQRSNLIKI